MANTPGSLLDFLDDEQNPRVKHRAWFDKKRFILVTSDNIVECIVECIAAGRFSLDLETTGLDNRVKDNRTIDQIVGVCLSPDGVRGYYIPLRHRKGVEHNIPFSVFDREFRRLIDAVEAMKAVAIFHNGKFDQEFLECNGDAPYGLWDKPSQWDDTMIQAYLDDSRRKNKQLKHLSKEYLGIEQVSLNELFPEGAKKDFSLLDPSDQDTLYYAGGDAICTYLLDAYFLPRVLTPEEGHTQKSIYQIEKLCVAATRWMERNRIHIDRERVMRLIILGQKEWYDSIFEVYDEAERILGRDVMPGYYKVIRRDFKSDDPNMLLGSQLDRAKGCYQMDFPNPLSRVKGRDGKEWPPIYDVSAPKQLGEMFDEMGVPGLQRTEKSGQVKTSKDVLERVIDEAGRKFPFMGKVKRFRETQKALSNNLFRMLEDSDPGDDTMRINFQGHKVDTGRFSTPSKDKARRKMRGWPEINFQGIPSTYDPRRPECMNRMRDCVTGRPVPEGAPPRFMVAIDFAGEELRLVTNLSLEPMWLTEFFRCSGCGKTFPQGEPGVTPPPPPPRCPVCGSDKIGNIHTLTAINIYGEDAPQKPEWKQLRNNSKCVHPDTLLGTEGGFSLIGSEPFRFGPPDTFEPFAGLVWDGSRYVNIMETYNGGDKPLFHVVTERGVITCSENHLLKTVGGGDLASVAEGLVQGVFLQNPQSLPPLLPGEFPAISSQVEGSTVTLQTSPEMAYGVGAQGTRVPWWVLKSGRGGVLAYLGGLFGENGSLGRDGSILLPTPDLVLAGQVAALVDALGGHIRMEKVGESYRLRAWVVRTPIAERLDSSWQHLLRFPPVIPSPGSRVLDIVEAGTLPCVDLHLDTEDHLYLANGHLVHNSTNFALCYGGGGFAVVRATSCSKQEGHRIKRQFDQTYKGLARWWKGQHAFGRQYGYVRTGFGRKYPVPDITNADGFFRSKAERNAINGPIQGSGGDIIKIAMGLIYKEFRKRGWLHKVMLIACMHDELVFEMDADVMEEAIQVAVEIMTNNIFIRKRKWPVPFTCDVEIGPSWYVPWDLNEMKYGEVRFIGDEKFKKPEALENPDDWAGLPSWPESLRPYFQEAQGKPPLPPGGTPPPSPAPKVTEEAPVPEAPSEPAPQATAERVPEPAVETAKSEVEVEETPGVETVSMAAEPTGVVPSGEERAALDALVDLASDPAPAVPVATAATPPPAAPKRATPQNDDFVFQVTAPLTLDTAIKLADVIVRSMGKGTHILRLQDPGGQSLDAWLQEATKGKDVQVSARTFSVLAGEADL